MFVGLVCVLVLLGWIFACLVVSVDVLIVLCLLAWVCCWLFSWILCGWDFGCLGVYMV